MMHNMFVKLCWGEPGYHSSQFSSPLVTFKKPKTCHNQSIQHMPNC